MFVFEGKARLQQMYTPFYGLVSSAIHNEYICGNTPFGRSSNLNIAKVEITYSLCWNFLHEMTVDYLYNGWVLTPAGNLVKVDYSFFESPSDTYQPFNGLVNIRSGLTHSSQDHLPFWSAASCEELIAPLANCPIYLEDEDNLIFDEELIFDSSQGDLIKVALAEWIDKRSDLLERSALLEIEVRAGVEVEYIDGAAESPDLLEEDAMALFMDSYISGTATQPDEPQKSSLTTVYECTKQGFPDGKRNATWKEVERRVGYSRRSITRALKKNEDYEMWMQGGQTIE